MHIISIIPAAPQLASQLRSLSRACAVAVLLLLQALAGPAMAQETIKLGAIYATTGSASFLGAPEERILRECVDQANRHGGINGHKIELTVYDTEGNSGKAAQQWRRLVDADKVDVVFGPSSSGESLAVLAIANEARTPVLMHGGAESITKPVTPYVFNTPPSDRISLSGLLAYLKKTGITSVAMLSASDGFGQSGKNILQELAPNYGIRIAAQEEFGRQDPDITAQVLRAKESNAGAMIIWSALPAPVIILKAAQAVGYGKPIFTSYGAGTNDLVTQAAGAAEGLYLYSLRMLAPESIKDSDPVKPVILALNSEYTEKYKTPAPVYAQHAYDAFLILEQAVRKITGPVNRESLRGAIEQVDVIGTNGHYRFSAQNHGGLDAQSESFVMLRSVKGKWVAVD
jgi:branched-chain amino acid transport system substrate-binding protein